MVSKYLFLQRKLLDLSLLVPHHIQFRHFQDQQRAFPESMLSMTCELTTQ